MEKRNIKLRVITLADVKRFKSKTLHNIIGNMRAKNEKLSLQELAEKGKYLELMKHAARKSLINRSDKKIDKQIEKIVQKYRKKEEIEKESLESTLIDEKQYDKNMKYIQYKMDKEIYEKNLIEEMEKPKNPKLDGVRKVFKSIGRVITFPFRMMGKGINKLYKGSKIKLLTAGRIYKQYKEMEQVVEKEETIKTANKVSEKIDRTSTLQEKQKIINKVPQKIKDEIILRDWEDAEQEYAEKIVSDWDNTEQEYAKREELEESIDKESEEVNKEQIEDEQEAKRQREAERRRNLHMNEEPEEINYEQVKVEQRENIDPKVEAFSEKLDRKTSLKNKQKLINSLPKEIKDAIIVRDWDSAEQEEKDELFKKALKEGYTMEQFEELMRDDENEK